MKKFLLEHKEFLLGMLLTSSLLWPLFAAPYFTHHDDVQIIRLYEIDKCFKDHQIPCRWVPDLGGLYGYPIFNYYAPLAYYFGEIFYFLTHNLLISAKIMFAFSFLGSFIFMYLLARKFWGKLGGSLSAIFYSFAPYHSVDFYVRGAMGELWALMLFPAIFWSLARLEENPTIVNLVLLSFLQGILIVSHNLSAMFFFPISIVWAVFLFMRSRKRKFIWYSCLGFVLGILLSSFYLLPMLFEKNLVHVDSTTFGYFSYTEHFKGLRKLFIERTWGWGASVREVPGGEKDGLSFQIGWVHLIGWVLALFSAKLLWKKQRWISLSIILSSVAILFFVFMIHPRSEFIWKAIEPLKYLQFPWRFLMMIIFFLCFICGSFVLTNLKFKRMIWLVLIILVVILNFSYFRPEKFIQTSDSQRLSDGDFDKQIKRSIFDYLPIFAKAPPAELATKRYEILTGDATVYNYSEGTNWISFNALTKTHTIVRLSQYYFPDWKIYIDGVETKVDYKSNSLGLMTIILGEGDHKVYARLYDTQIRLISNWLSIAGFTILAALYITSFKRVRRWMAYYKKGIS